VFPATIPPPRRITQRKFQGFAMVEISVSLAVTAEGHIGIATAGVASIEVTFRRSDRAAHSPISPS
jgi:hypothetical protein